MSNVMRLKSMLAAVLMVLAVSPAFSQDKAAEPAGKLLVITGVDRYHDWNALSQKARQILNEAGFEVVITEDPWVVTTPGMEAYDGIVLVLNTDPRWPRPVEEAFAAQISGGKALGIIHSANNCFPGWSEFEDMVGLLWRTNGAIKAGHDHYGPYTVEIVDKDHFITTGMEDFPITDELYRDLTKYSEFHVLAQGFSRDKQAYYPLIMTKTYGKGRVFHTALGHDVNTMSSAGFQRTLQRGMLWAVGKDK
jgi:type 1 glutamine amidotransferase